MKSLTSNSELESNKLKIDSLAAIPLCNTTLISASLFIGANINIIAVIKDINVPTEIASKYPSEVTKNIMIDKNKATIN